MSERLSADIPENLDAPCNICGRGWPYHEPACVYRQSAKELTDARAANAALQERLRVVEAGLVAAREALREVDGTGMTGWEDCTCFHCGRYRMIQSALAALVPDTERTEQ